MSILIHLLLAQLTGVPADPPVTPDATIVVTAPALTGTRATLDQCLARHCPPAEDIAATIAHAENQVIAGDLAGARTTLLQSRGRNRRHAATDAVAVSGLLHFNARVALLLGLDDSGLTGTIDSLSALKEGLSADDRHIAIQRLLVADVFLRRRVSATAVRMYDEVAARAAAAGWPDIQAAAMFRALTFYATAASVDPAYADRARRRYAMLRGMDDPAFRTARDASLLLEARLALLKDRTAPVDAVMKGLGPIRTSSPMLVSMPTIDLMQFQLRSGLMDTGDMPPRWIDLGFRITGEGIVADLEVTGRSPGADDRWMTLVEHAVAGRRYLPIDLPPGSTGVWRRERFMLVASRMASKGTRIRKSVGTPRLHVIDLSAPAGPASARPQRDDEAG